jgi:ribosomal protein S27AE
MNLLTGGRQKKRWGIMLGKRAGGSMNKHKSWDELYNEASEKSQSWRAANKQASLTDIENQVDANLAELRAKMIEELAHESELADIRQVAREKRPKCPECGAVVNADGQRTRRLVTEHDQEVKLTRSKATCPKCGLSFFPSG